MPARFRKPLRLFGQEHKLKKLFHVIEKQTGYGFVYDPSLLKKEDIVDASFNKTPLKDVLGACLENKPLTFEITNEIIVIRAKEKIR